ncbi:hypothetical protein DI53_0303 [Sphingobacterium deserti]|uniref:Uncharacterized protein n=1 Tax=Sphingobacterium deserti TaxID=1229276 RepID=A0A0B8TAH7_9SPHI|nr:hypothetical protein DI53_0303 [Sphingobacterium deserti]
MNRLTLRHVDNIYVPRCGTGCNRRVQHGFNKESFLVYSAAIEL